MNGNIIAFVMIAILLISATVVEYYLVGMCGSTVCCGCATIGFLAGGLLGFDPTWKKGDSR